MTTPAAGLALGRAPRLDGGVRAWGAVLFALMLPLHAQADEPEPPGQLVDMVVAEVDATVITYSELLAEARLVLSRTRGPDVARTGVLAERLLRSVLQNIVHRELILGEIRRLQLREVPEPEVRKVLEQIRRPFATLADFDRFLQRAGFRDATSPTPELFDAPASLVAIVRAELGVERFLEVRIRLDVEVQDADVVACWEASPGRFGERTLSQMRGRIREQIRTQRQDRALRTLLEDLTARARVRYAPGLEPLREEPPAQLGFSCPEVAPR